MAPAYPAVAGLGEGWSLVEESVETVFRLSSARVRGATRRYEDERTRRAVREATDGGLDREWRFVAATRLDFDPPLPPGTPRSMVRPTVASEARRSFADRLAGRGLTDIERRRSERIRREGGTRVRLARYDAVDEVAGHAVRVAGWVGVWNDGGDFFVVTGGYPDVPLADALDTADPPACLQGPVSEYREEFVAFVRNVA
jgi:hypothetical protein